MKVYCLNDEAYGDQCGDQFEWMAYWYEAGDYDGRGEAVALGKDGFLYLTDLSHCSCYGPFEDYWDGTAAAWDKVNVEDFLGSLDQVHGYVSEKELEAKVVELLAAREG